MTRATIFLTGAAILALQLIASRVLAPFFGVSLYIWTGILAITLLCLAFGYGYGSHFTRRAPRHTMVFTFYLLPAIAALAIALSTAVYPIMLGPLARLDLLLGSFVAATLLLAVPLVALSALNPLLVAIDRSVTGDAGAGRVFFISTIGSVAGVLVAAFYLIPSWSNIESLAQISLLLSAVAAAGATSPPLRAGHRAWIAGTTALAMVGSAIILLIWASGGAGRTATDGSGRSLTVLASYPSPFGAIKVVDLRGPDLDIRMLLNEGVVQNRLYGDGRSASPFTYVLDAAASHLQPAPKRVLVLGLGAGVVPMAFAKRGARVDVVEINPRMAEVARRHFGLEELANISLWIADARTFVRNCAGSYDLVFVDLFVGDGTPEHLMTREFLTDVRRCLAPHGAVAANSFLDIDYPNSYSALLATFADVFGTVAFAHIPVGTGGTNGFVIASRQEYGLVRLRELEADLDLVPPALQGLIDATLTSLVVMSRHSPFLARQPILTDASNRLSVLAAPAQMAYRQRILRSIPDTLLVN